MARVRDPPDHTPSPDRGSKAHQGHGTIGGTGQWIPYVSKGHRKGHGTDPMGNSVLPPDQVHAPACLCLEDGGQDHGPPTQGGPYAGLFAEGALHASLRTILTLPAEVPLVGMQRRQCIADWRSLCWGLVLGLPEPHQGHCPMVSLCHYSGRTPLGIQGWQPTE